MKHLDDNARKKYPKNTSFEYLIQSLNNKNEVFCDKGMPSVSWAYPFHSLNKFLDQFCIQIEYLFVEKSCLNIIQEQPTIWCILDDVEQMRRILNKKAFRITQTPDNFKNAYFLEQSKIKLKRKAVWWIQAYDFSQTLINIG